MVNMAETEAAAMLVGHGLAVNGGDDTSDELDSELELERPLLTKRNKRKNFQPRNICYSEAVPGGGESGGEDDLVLDLSRGEQVASRRKHPSPGGGIWVKRFAASPTLPPAWPCPAPAPGPIDLSCPAKPPPPTLHEADVNTHDSDKMRYSERREYDARQYVLQQALLQGGGHHPAPTDASDLKEYAQNTVKELLQIYGLNSAEVAESITNNVPIANFSSGKILESLSARSLQSLRYPGGGEGSSPPTPPHTPHSPHSPPVHPQARTPNAKSPPDSMAAKFVSLASSANSRGMSLPQNMATILALAALQEHGRGAAGLAGAATTAPGAAATPSTSNNHAAADSSVVSPLQQGNRDTKAVVPVDYSRYVRRFASALECGASYCKDLNYREHFHCLDCNSRVFVKKEEMIRHFKWHKKRDESLQHGFMRYSPGDDCSERYHSCSHNRKQTHYHCIQGTCDKVYISTSDVQMHANYHRKDSAIIQEGFQRLRATEECRTPYCAFYGQKTTHFHCRRDHCQFTFKNKADMEKHKTYHIKDEQLARDGFKKFLKPDVCGFPNCRFSQVCNHIHCVREGCTYVLHSSGQLLSHKRKHERQDSENSYRKFKLAQQAAVSLSSSEQSRDSPGSSLQLLQQVSSLAALTALHDGFSNSSSEGRTSPSSSKAHHITSQQPSLHFKLSPGTGTPPSFLLDHSASSLDLSSMDECNEVWPRYLTHFTANQACLQPMTCPFQQQEHFHCREAACEVPFRCRESAESHGRVHEAQDRVNDSFYLAGPSLCQETCPRGHHFHCTWEGCSDAVLPIERMEHYRNHEIAVATHNNSLEALFRRKRGRPPKNRVIEVWNDYSGGIANDSPQAIFTSFKLPKPTMGANLCLQSDMSRTPSPANEPTVKPSLQMLELHGFQSYNEGCPDPVCMFSSKTQHYHCSRPRCFFATDSEELLLAHSKDFHDNIDILDGFLFFDRSVDCRLDNCHSNKVNRHFHCVRPGCGYSFVRYSSMAMHQAKHQSEAASSQSPNCIEPMELGEAESPQEESQSRAATQSPEATASNVSRTTVVKASGTFYPLCGLSNLGSSSPTSPTATNTDVTTCAEPRTDAVLPEWMGVEQHERYGPEQSCSRPFCKLKRKEHYHCNACNQAFSEMERLRPHIAKHSPGAIPPVLIKSEANNNEDNNDEVMGMSQRSLGLLPLGLEGAGELLPPPLPMQHYPHGFSAAMAAAVAANQQLALITSQGGLPFMPHALYTSPTGLMFATPPGFTTHHPMVSNGLLESARASILGTDPSTPETMLSRRSLSPARDMSPEAKKARVQSSMRILKDEPVPEGYLRFRFNEDCRYSHCGYREHQTHFHCMRQDCGYSFCDKTRFVQHTARHERLDTLMGGDFQQYRQSVACGRPECAYTPTLVQNKSSHFHCLKCDFVCTDTNKVVAHRRQHQKLDSIMAAGFEKFTPSQPCMAPESCVHSGKQTHYHCLSCQYAVLGLSQMTAHKYRHLE